MHLKKMMICLMVLTFQKNKTLNVEEAAGSLGLPLFHYAVLKGNILSLLEMKGVSHI